MKRLIFFMILVVFGFSCVQSQVRLAGEMNETPREKYVPTNYVTQTTTEKDETLAKGIELINKIAD